MKKFKFDKGAFRDAAVSFVVVFLSMVASAIFAVIVNLIGKIDVSVAYATCITGFLFVVVYAIVSVYGKAHDKENEDFLED